MPVRAQRRGSLGVAGVVLCLATVVALVTGCGAPQYTYVTNSADRPVQVGSHYHFAAVNPGLEFDRAAAWGRHLDIPAGTSVRFEPGVEREVVLVPLGGARRVPGLRPEYAGALDERGSEPEVQ